jgi:hypothetical protein
MSPRWLHWPAAAAAPGPAYAFTADLASATGTRFGLSSVIESGSTGDFNPTANSQPIRYAVSTNDSITLLIGKTGSIDHTTPGLDAKFYHDNGSGYNEFVPNVLTFGDLAGTLLTIKLEGVGSPGTAGSFWSNMDNGESVKLELYY